MVTCLTFSNKYLLKLRGELKTERFERGDLFPVKHVIFETGIEARSYLASGQTGPTPERFTHFLPFINAKNEQKRSSQS